MTIIPLTGIVLVIFAIAAIIFSYHKKEFARFALGLIGLAGICIGWFFISTGVYFSTLGKPAVESSRSGGAHLYRIVWYEGNLLVTKDAKGEARLWQLSSRDEIDPLHEWVCTTAVRADFFSIKSDSSLLSAMLVHDGYDLTDYQKK